MVFVAAFVSTQLAAAEPQRWALLVGVNDYVGFSDLRYSGRDAVGLAEALRGAGFDERHVFLLHDEAKDAAYRPSKSNIERHLNAVLNLAGPDDLVIVSFSGHGIHYDGQSYLCPPEADDRRPAESMVAVGDVYKRFETCKAALKLLLVDACRNDPRPPGRKSASPDVDRKALGETFARPPAGIMVLQSCAEDQISWEDEQLQHGVFMHHVLKGLEGNADGNKNGRVTLGELYEYASDETKLFVANRFAGEVQIPALNGNIRGVFEFPRIGPAKDFTNSIGMQLTLIPAGEFQMGSPTSELGDFGEHAADESPQHRVRITKPFYLGTYEVTRGQFAQFVAADDYQTETERDGYGLGANGQLEEKPEYDWRNPSFAQTGDHPVVNVAWGDAAAFCKWLSDKEGKTYSLPSEAQWEYACRAGTATKYYHGDDSEGLATIGNVADGTIATKFSHSRTIKAHDSYVFTAPVGRFKPNAFGLYDMTGNVLEFCNDWYDSEYYGRSPLDDPTGLPEGSTRLYRGGSYLIVPGGCRSACRNECLENYRRCDLGFRIALVP